MNISTHSVISSHRTGFKPPAQTADEDTTASGLKIMRFQMITSAQSQRLRSGVSNLLKTLALSFSYLIFLVASFASAQVAATPVFSPAAGTYSSAQTVTISTTTPS